MLNPGADQASILARANTILGVDVLEGIPDGELVVVEFGVPQPYYTCDFGTPIAASRGRSLAPGEEYQPTVQRVILSAVSSDKAESREMSNNTLALVGFQPSTNASELRLVGGGGFSIARSATRPTLYVTETFFVWTGKLEPEFDAVS